MFIYKDVKALPASTKPNFDLVAKRLGNPEGKLTAFKTASENPPSAKTICTAPPENSLPAKRTYTVLAENLPPTKRTR